MAVKFSPNGNLDVTTDPSELPSTLSEKDEISGAMVRCTNLHLDRMGIASTRKGSSKINASAMGQTSPNLIIEQEGDRYCFNGTDIYKNEVSIKSALTPYNWAAVKYNAYNSSILNIFALNGSERERISLGSVYSWGMEAPDGVPVISTGAGTGLTGSYNAMYSYVRKEGDTIVYESNPSDAAAANVTLTNKSFKIRMDPPTDPQINAVRIYRTDLNGANYYYLTTLNVPTASYTYAYCYDWEASDLYITGSGYQITQSIPDTAGQLDFQSCDYLSDSDGTWTHSAPWPQWISVNNTIYKTEPGSVRGYIGSYGSYIKLTKSSGTWDLSPYTQIKVWLYTATTITASSPSGCYLYFGQSTYNEQKTGPFSLAVGWTQKTWDISSIAAADRSNVTMFSVGSDGWLLGDAYIYVDSPCADAGGSYVTYRRLHSWEPVGTTTDSGGKKTYYWEPVIIDDNTADSSLGTEVPSDHDRPPAGSFVFGPSYSGMLFILKDNLMYYSLEKQPEYWPTSYYLEIASKDFVCKSGCIHDGQIYVATTNDIYMVPGTSHTSFSAPLSMSAITGTISPNCFLPIHGHGIFHLGNDGIYLLSGKDENITNSRFKPIFDGTTVGSMPGVDKTNLKNSWMAYFNNNFYFGYPKSGSTYPDNIVVTDLSTGRAVHYDYSQTFRCIGIDYTNNRLLAVDTSGYVWKIEDSDVTTDGGTAISWQIESKEYSDQLRKYFPRWARYDLTLGTGATANAFIILNGTSKQTHSLTTSRKTKKRLITGCTGDRIALRITGTGPVDIYAAEVE